MNIQQKLHDAFQVIQQSPELYKKWNDCRTKLERDLMLAEQMWETAFQLGYEHGYKQCDEDVSMGG